MLSQSILIGPLRDKKRGVGCRKSDSTLASHVPRRWPHAEPRTSTLLFPSEANVSYRYSSRILVLCATILRLDGGFAGEDARGNDDVPMSTKEKGAPTMHVQVVQKDELEHSVPGTLKTFRRKQNLSMPLSVATHCLRNWTRST